MGEESGLLTFILSLKSHCDSEKGRDCDSEKGRDCGDSEKGRAP